MLLTDTGNDNSSNNPGSPPLISLDDIQNYSTQQVFMSSIRPTNKNIWYDKNNIRIIYQLLSPKDRHQQWKKTHGAREICCGLLTRKPLLPLTLLQGTRPTNIPLTLVILWTRPWHLNPSVFISYTGSKYIPWAVVIFPSILCSMTYFEGCLTHPRLFL